MIPKEELEDMYYGKGMSQSEIADKIGMSKTTVSRWMKKFCIESRTVSESHLINSANPSKKKLEDMYWVRKMSTYEIADAIGVSQMTVFTWMRILKIKTRTKFKSKLVNVIKPSKKELEKMYWSKGMSSYEIADDIGVSRSTIFNWMKEFGIESRDRFEFTGENAHNWHGGISFEPYCYKFNNAFKEAVRERDDYTCQLCGYEQKLDGRRLSIHHVHYDKENCYPDVVALCNSCNGKVNGNRNHWEEYFENQLIERGLFCWSINSF